MGGASRWWLNGSLAALHADLTNRVAGASACAMAALRRSRGAARRDWRVAQSMSPAAMSPGSRNWKRRWHVPRGRGAAFRVFGGRLLFEPEAIVTGDGKPYRVFTPFWKACLAAAAPRMPLPQPKLLRFAEAKSDRLEALKLLPTRPDWAEGLRDTWQPGEAHALRDSAPSSRIASRTMQRIAAGSISTRHRVSRRISISARSAQARSGMPSPTPALPTLGPIAAPSPISASSAGANSPIICCITFRRCRPSR